MSKFNSHAEFQQLKEVVVGQGYPPAYFDHIEDQEVRENLNLYDFDQCYIFIALSGVKPRLFPIYGDWGSAKDSHWSKYYDYHGLECRMDGTDFDYEKGRELIFNVLKTNGVKKGDTTFESFVDLKFRGFLNEQGLNLDDTDNPLNSFHPDNAIYTDIINEWLKRKEVEYLNECEKAKLDSIFCNCSLEKITSKYNSFEHAMRNENDFPEIFNACK